jgi:hypothetical protein
MPFWAWTVDRPAKWKFLMRNRSLDRCFDSAYPGEAPLHDIFIRRSAMGWYTSGNAGFAGVSPNLTA